MPNEYEMEKWVWTDADFQQISWHDSPIYAFAFLAGSNEFVLDIDYILRWVQPTQDEAHFNFGVFPATLVFENACDIKFDLKTRYGIRIDIQKIDRRNPKVFEAGFLAGTNEWHWVIEAQEGEISLDATGYKQFFRKKPFFQREQTLESDNRNRVSFYRGRFDK